MDLAFHEGQPLWLTVVDTRVQVVFLGIGGKRARRAAGPHPWVRMLSDHGVYARGMEVRVSWDRLSTQK